MSRIIRVLRSNCWVLHRNNDLRRLSKILDILKGRKIADMDSFTDFQRGHVCVDVIGKLRGAATNLDFVGLVVQNTAVAFDAEAVCLADKVDRNTGGEDVATLDLLEVDVINRALDRMILNVLNQAKCGCACIVCQLDKRSTAADFTIQIAKINRRNRNRTRFALTVERRRDSTIRAEPTGDAAADAIAISYLECVLLHVKKTLSRFVGGTLGIWENAGP